MAALPDDFWAAEEDALKALLIPLLTNAGIAGAQSAADDLVNQIGAAPDWTQVNGAVHDWVSQYGFDLVSQITDTVAKATAQAIDTWVASGAPLPDLIDALTPMFGETRAELIATTEVTRAFAEGNRAAWQSSGLVDAMRWMTAQDELVCPECGPMAGQELPLNSSDVPPAHPRCRCWVQPVVNLP